MIRADKPREQEAAIKIVQCPACNIFIEKVSGSNEMMCGCEARPAGGTLEKALAGGGCGHEFDFATLKGLG